MTADEPNDYTYCCHCAHFTYDVYNGEWYCAIGKCWREEE